MEIDPIESFYLMLSGYNYQVKTEDSELVDSLRYQWNNLITFAKDLKDNLYKNQDKHLNMLNFQVGGLVDDIEQFYNDWTHGHVINFLFFFQLSWRNARFGYCTSRIVQNDGKGIQRK